MSLRESERTVQMRLGIALVALLCLGPGSMAAQEATPPPAGTPPVVDALVAGQDVPVPTRKKYVAPQYPAAAAAEGIRGIVIVQVVIGEDGRVLETRVSRSIPGLDEAALAAVTLWEYEPTKVAGRPVKVLMSQSITFALKLPELQRELGVPELKSGGPPPVPRSLATPESASVAVTLGSQGEVREAAILDGNPALSEALLRAVRSWRFVVSTEAIPPSFTIRAEWTPGPTPSLLLKAFDAKAAEPAPASASPAATDNPSPTTALPPTVPAGTPEDRKAMAPSGAPEQPQDSPAAVETEVLPARVAPPAKEQGASGVADVMLGDNIPDLVRGRRPTWPPLARLGNIAGNVVVRFSVDLAGKATVRSSEGPELLKDSAEQAAATWLFRRTAIDQLNLVATFTFGGERTLARVERAP